MILSEVRLFQSIRHPETGEENFFSAIRHPGVAIEKIGDAIEVTYRGRAMCTPLVNVRSFVRAEVQVAKAVLDDGDTVLLVNQRDPRDNGVRTLRRTRKPRAEEPGNGEA